MMQIHSKQQSTSGRQRRTRVEWAQILSKFEASGLTQRRFCDEHGVAYSSFCYWRKRLAQDAAPVIELPLELEAARTSSSRNAVGWRVELDLGQGITVRIR